MLGQIDCSNLIPTYIDYLLSAFTVEQSNTDECQIVTPFMRPDGDFFSLFAIDNKDETILLTDFGETVDWFFSVGLDIESNKNREAHLEALAKIYGVNYSDGAISIVANRNTLGLSIHQCLMAIQSISQMIMLRRPQTQISFRDEVETYLVQHEQNYKPDYKVQGRTLEHRIDFYLNSGRNVLVEALSSNSAGAGLNIVKQTAFKFIDINQISPEYTRVVVLDDSRNRWESVWNKRRIQVPLETYTDRVIRWSQRVQLLAPLIK